MASTIMQFLDFMDHYLLFNAITDALDELRETEDCGRVEEILVSAQQRAEDRFLDESEDNWN